MIFIRQRKIPAFPNEQSFSSGVIYLCVDCTVDFGVGVGEAAENHFFNGGGEIAQNCFYGDFCRLFFWEMVNSGADAGKSNRFAVVFFCQSQRVYIAVFQEFGFMVVAAVPDRSGSVDDELGGQIESGRDAGFAGFAAVEFTAGFE